MEKRYLRVIIGSPKGLKERGLRRDWMKGNKGGRVDGDKNRKQR